MSNKCEISKSENNQEEILPKIKKSSKKVTPEIIVNITRDGTYIDNTSKLPRDLIKKIQNYFTLHDKTILGYFVHTSLWYYRNNKLYLPRFGSQLLKKKFINIKFVNSILPNNTLPEVIYKGIFKGNQKLIFDEIILNHFNQENMENGKAGLVLNLQAGHGKSFIAMSLINHLKCRSVVVTHNTTKLNEWVKLLEEFFPNLTIGTYYGKKKKAGDIIVGIINSLANDNIKLNSFNSMREFYDSFDLIILDECHEYVSKISRHIYDMCQAPYMLGLSATPEDRTSDSLDKVSKWCCGPILIAENIKEYTLDDIPFKGSVECIKYKGHPDYIENIINETTEMTSTPLVIGQICDDPCRLDLVTSLVIQQFKKGLQVLVFADRRKYLTKIKENITKVGNESIRSYLLEDLDTDPTKAILKVTLKEAEILEEISKKLVRLVGGSSAEEMQTAISTNACILTTYQFMGTGVSIPSLNSVILATPRKTKSRQYISRIFRLGSDYSVTREIIDIVDTKLTLKTQWYERKKYYDEQGYTITTKTISYKDV
ncbi:MAG: DEAD/DEAH box helicase [Cetobacterium sp.]